MVPSNELISEVKSILQILVSPDIPDEPSLFTLLAQTTILIYPFLPRHPKNLLMGQVLRRVTAFLKFTLTRNALKGLQMASLIKNSGSL